jgi:hypothetical protein
MNATSPWLRNVNASLNNPELSSIYEQDRRGYSFKVYAIEDSLWIIAASPKATILLFGSPFGGIFYCGH